MAITDDNKEKLKNRLAKAMGHLNAVHRMVDEKKYCVDVLHQMKAVQAALDKISEEILRQHLETCVVDAVKNQDTSRVIDELIQVFRRAPELNLDDLKLEGLPQKPLPQKALKLERVAVLSGNGKSCCD
ncbi:metal-sensitive transcriptional regulator [Vampirovibrio sp.]|uniref:metal-sensitive transcriptional regulator n=1 Tax=Vampirovibrio sp. TaxID=2717857 RepID=UPI00359343F0